MKTLTLAAIRCSLVFTVTASLSSVRPAEAYIVTLQQMGSDVVANGTGAINLTGLGSLGGTFQFGVFVAPRFGFIVTGPDGASGAIYIGFTGPSQFGPGLSTIASSGSGDIVGIDAQALSFIVPSGYISGTPLTDSATYSGQTFISLNVRQGTYVWSWGTGLPNQNFTLIIGSGVPPPVPDSGSTVSLLGFGLLSLAALRRKLTC